MTETRIFDGGSLAEAAEIVRGGGVAAVPTETVYGLAADALSESAVEKVFRAKGRPETKPVSIFVTDIGMAEKFCRVIPQEAYTLAERYWPGPLTMILPRRENVPDAITAGGEGVGVRVPANDLTLMLLRLVGRPLTGTSANLSGERAAGSGREALSMLKGRIDCVVDGGECTGGVPSTVVSFMDGEIKIVREGNISREELEKVLGTVVK